MGLGKNIWVFPDTELPPEGVNAIPGHESVIILNTGSKNAHVKITFYYEDKPPVLATEVVVESQRVRCLRTSRETDFHMVTPVVGEQYAIVVESDVPVVAQYGRAETREVAFYTTPGYFSDVSY